MEGLSWDSLRKIVLFDTDGTKGRYDLRLANLENYISICKKYEKYCVLELKSVFTQEETDAMIRLIDGLGWSFSFPSTMRIWRRCVPHCRISPASS